MNPRQYRELERQADVIEQNKKLNMKTFNDLVFNPHPINNGVVSRLYFGNGYGVSVVTTNIAPIAQLVRAVDS